MVRPIRGFAYQDVFTPWRRVLSWRSGQAAKIKRQYRRWERREGKKEARRGQEDQ